MVSLTPQPQHNSHLPTVDAKCKDLWVLSDIAIAAVATQPLYRAEGTVSANGYGSRDIYCGREPAQDIVTVDITNAVMAELETWVHDDELPKFATVQPYLTTPCGRVLLHCMEAYRHKYLDITALVLFQVKELAGHRCRGDVEISKPHVTGREGRVLVMYDVSPAY